MTNKPDRLTTVELDACIEMDRSVLDDVQIETEESDDVDDVTGELQQFLDEFESERGSEYVNELVERLDESNFTQSEIQEIVEEASECNSVFPPESEGDE